MEYERMEICCSVCGKMFKANVSGIPPKKCNRCKGYQSKRKPQAGAEEESRMSRLRCSLDFYILNRKLINDAGRAARLGMSYGRYMAQKREGRPR